MARPAPVVIRCRGDERITASHTKTFELSADPAIGPRATCVVGVAARVEGDRAALDGLVEITLDAAGLRQTVQAEANPFAPDGLVVRKSDFRGHDTLAVNADVAAADLDRALVAALADPATELVVSVRPVGPRPRRAVFTDRDSPAIGDAGDNDGIDEVVAASPLAQLNACAALAAPGAASLLVLRGRPRKQDVAAALAASPVVVWQGPPADAKALRDHADAVVAVDRGEAVTRVERGWPDRLAADAVVTVAIAGTAGNENNGADLEPLLRALRAEGVTARTLRQALARVPGTPGAKGWDYDAISRL
jgi:hypothetical protein